MKKWESKKRLAKHITQYLVASILVAFAEGSMAEVPVFNIEKPNDEGISFNQYEEYNIGSEGMILNNAVHETETKLAGRINENIQLQGRPAEVIVQEVIGNRRSVLEGPLEIAGEKADVLIANSNGIYTNGASFFNANHVSLYAGTMPHDNQKVELDTLRIDEGKIEVGQKGIQAKENDLNLAGRTIYVAGKVWAKNLNLLADKGNVLLTATTKLEKTDKPEERFIDIAKTGGLYADAIYIKAAEAGTAIRNQGILYGENNISLSSNGDIILLGDMASPKVSIKTENNATVSQDQRNSVENKIAAKEKPLLWNIEEPNSNGISTYTVDRLYVGENGLIINNSVDDIKTKNDEIIEGNGKLKNNPAHLIVGEVRNGHSIIRGNLEIAGERADLLIASPGGLSLLGGKSVNVGRLAFMTGKWSVHQDTPRLTVSANDRLEVGESGFDGREATSVTLITHALRQSADVLTPSLQVISGADVDASYIRSDRDEGSLTIPVTLQEKSILQTYKGEKGAL